MDNDRAKDLKSSQMGKTTHMGVDMKQGLTQEK